MRLLEQCGIAKDHLGIGFSATLFEAVYQLAKGGFLTLQLKAMGL